MSSTVSLLPLSNVQNETENYDLLLFRIAVSERIDMENSYDLWALLYALIAGGVKKILVDLTDLEYIDSSGISVLINAAKNMRTQKGDIAFYGASHDIRDIFKVVHLHGFIKLFSLEAEALSHFRYL